jgi:outer membrane protein assembly factor BamB
MKHPVAWFCCLLLLSVAGVCPAQEWTRFRGPNGAGQSEAKFPAEFSERDLTWKVSLPGAGHSSPVLWGKQIFLTSAEAEQGRRWLLSLKASDGSLLWKKEFPFHTYHVNAQNGFATGTPTVDADRVYCTWATPEQYFAAAFDHQGKELWRVELGPFPSEHGYGASPMLYQDLLIVTNDQDGNSSLQALDCKDGSVRWRIPRQQHLPDKNSSYSVPCIYQPPKGPAELIHNSWAHGITSLDPLTGATNWELPVFERRTVSSPIIVDGLILGSCGEGGGKNTMVAVRPGVKNGRSPELVYKLDKTYAAYVPTMVNAGNLVFLWGDRGIVTCIDGPTGKLHWRERVGGNFSGSPVRAADKIFCVSADGEVVALAASDQFKVLGRSPLNETCRSTPAIVGNRMYLRTESHLLCLPGSAK